MLVFSLSSPQNFPVHFVHIVHLSIFCRDVIDAIVVFFPIFAMALWHFGMLALFFIYFFPWDSETLALNPFISILLQSLTKVSQSHQSLTNLLVSPLGLVLFTHSLAYPSLYCACIVLDLSPILFSFALYVSCAQYIILYMFCFFSSFSFSAILLC